MYREIYIKKCIPMYTLSTQCIYVFCVDLRTASLSVYNINLVFFYIRTVHLDIIKVSFIHQLMH